MMNSQQRAQVEKMETFMIAADLPSKPSALRVHLASLQWPALVNLNTYLSL